MSVEFFLDTNILVYVVDVADRKRQARARDLVTTVLADGTACISWQVAQEFLNVVTSKLRPVVPVDLARQYLEEILLPMCTIWPSDEVYRSALAIKASHRLHFYDCLIVASALSGGCTTLLSEDMQNGQRFGGLAIRNPFDGH